MNIDTLNAPYPGGYSTDVAAQLASKEAELRLIMERAEQIKKQISSLRGVSAHYRTAMGYNG